jgi:hypothetical protein
MPLSAFLFVTYRGAALADARKFPIRPGFYA